MADEKIIQISNGDGGFLALTNQGRLFFRHWPYDNKCWKEMDQPTLNKTKPRSQTKSEGYSDDFLDFWAIYPKGHGGSKKEAFRQYKGKNANASKADSERNANGMLPNTQYPIPITDNKDKKKVAKRFAPPSLDEVNSYILEKQYDIDGQYFIDFYESKGWMIGKNKMKDWKATIRGWQARNKKGGSNGQNNRQNISRSERVANKVREIGQRDIEENGLTGKLD